MEKELHTVMTGLTTAMASRRAAGRVIRRVFHGIFLKGFDLLSPSLLALEAFSDLSLLLACDRQSRQSATDHHQESFFALKDAGEENLFVCAGAGARFECYEQVLGERRAGQSPRGGPVAFRVKMFCLKNRTAWLIVPHL